MMYYLTFILLIAVVQAAPQTRQFGICAELCMSGSCPSGYSCVYNGCGHSCEPTPKPHPGKNSRRGACIETCTMDGDPLFLGFSRACPEGFECRSNGCGHTCQRVNPSSVKRADCAPVLCDLWCPHGWAKGEDGCPVCSCKRGNKLDLTLLGPLG